MKHTPGPWAVTTDVNNRKTLVYSPIKNMGIAKCSWINNENESEVLTAEADARLIAAAPELLATLKKVVEYHKYVQEKCIWHLEANAQVDLIDILRETQAAIANATKEG